MALDRQSIEKKDFPVGRRGYDPGAVDAHLAALAEEVASFKREAPARPATLSSSASDQVRAIVEAAEASASDIQRQAECEAKQIREEASSEARSTRQRAADQAREYVGKVSESTATMLERLDAMDGELSALVESLRTGANRLNADLQLLEGNLAELGGAVTPHPTFEPDAGTGSGKDSSGGTEGETGIEEEVGDFGKSHEPSHVEDSEVASQAEDADDAEGARLIALNMALSGTSRDETAKYLSENFRLSDCDGLLDEVYASVG